MVHVHVPAKFQGNTAMCHRVTVQKHFHFNIAVSDLGEATFCSRKSALKFLQIDPKLNCVIPKDMAVIHGHIPLSSSPKPSGGWIATSI